MYEEGKENPIIEKIWSKFPLKANEKVSISLSANDIQAMLPSRKMALQAYGIFNNSTMF